MRSEGSGYAEPPLLVMNKICLFQNIFKSADEDKSGTISVPELRVALKEAGT